MTPRWTGLAGLALAAALATGASAQEYTFRFQSSDPAGNPNFQYQKGWTEAVAEKTGGRVEIQLLPVGSVVEYNETLDAVGAGILDGHITDASYWTGRNPAFGLLANPVGAWSEPEQMFEFVDNAGGLEILNDLLEPYGVHAIGVTTPGIESFVSRVPIDTVEDLQGVKVRAPEGLVGNVFAAAGAAPVNLPSSEVYTSLDKGVVDAADYSVFSVNQAQGLNEIAPHPVYPGFHSMPLIEVSMNKAKWDALPDDLKEILEASIQDFRDAQLGGLREANEAAVEEAKAAGVTIHDWSEEERAKFRGIAKGEWEKIATQSPEAQRVYDELTAYLVAEGLIQE